MNRKFLAKILAVSMVFTAAPVMPGIEANADAEELSISSQTGNKDLGFVGINRKAEADIPDLDCTGWWTAHTNGIEVDENGISLTFKNTSYESAAVNWNTPLYVVYTNNEPKVNNASPDYKEYMVRRSDNFTLEAFQNSTTSVSEFPANFDWAVWLGDNKKGADDYQISAIRTDDTVLVKFISHGIVSYSAIPVEKGKPAYLSLTGDNCKLSEIKQVNYVDFVKDIPESLFVETLPGKGKWNDGTAYGRKYNLTGDGTLDLYVGYVGKEKDISPDAMFNIELRDSDNKGITTESTGNAWSFGYSETVTAPAITVSGPDGKTVGEGHQYKISVTRTGDDVKVVYYDITSQETFIEVDTKETKFPETITVQTIAQFGTFQVCQDKLVMPEFKIGNCYTSQAWWSGTGVTEKQVLSGDGEVSWYIGYYENIGNERGAFSAELVAEKDGLKYFITTGSNVDAWYASEPKGSTHTEGDKITGIALDSKKIELGHKYRVTAKRAGQDFTITYFDLDTNSVYAEFVAANTTFPEGDVNVHIMAQVGKFKIEKEQFDVMPEVKDNSKPLAPYQPVFPTPAPTPVPTPAPTLPPDDEDSEGLELDCGAFWSAHTGGMEVTESGMAVTFRNNTHADAVNGWDIPLAVAYTGDVPVVNGAGYKEYVVVRGDGYAWANADGDINTGAGLASWSGLGYTFEANPVNDSWLEDNKSGTECKVQAVKSDGKVIIETKVGSVTSKTTFPVEDGKKVYISLTGEQCKLTNIKPAAYTGIAGVTANPSASATPAPSADPSASPDPAATADPGSTEAPGTTDPGTNPGDKDPGTNNPDSEKPSDSDEDNNDKEDNETKKTMKVSGITAKAGKKKVTGKLSVKGAKVTVKVGSKKAKNAKVNGKKFTFTASSKLKKGTKVTIKVTKSGYKAVIKTVKVK